MSKDIIDFGIPFTGIILLMFLYADILVVIGWIIVWAAIRYKFLKDSNVQQN